jgi:hypothetical protein
MGSIYHSVLRQEGESWKREDVCSRCFKPPEDQIFWKGLFKKREGKAPTNLLDEFLETEEPIWSSFLAEVLLRKGYLKKRGRHFFEIISTGEVVEIDPTPLSLEELPHLHERLRTL